MKTLASIPSLLSLAALLTLSSCGKEGAESGSDAGAAASRGPETTGALAVPSTIDPNVVDSAKGSLKASWGEPASPELTFGDVTASQKEQVIAGSTEDVLTIQAHAVPPNNHVRLRFIRRNGALEPGRYTLDDAEKLLDARWEREDKTYIGLAGTKAQPSGTADITSLTNNRVTGAFDLVLVDPLNDVSEHVKGTFDMRIER